MKKLMAITAVVAGLAFSGVALASNCPVLIKQGKDKLAEAQKLHDSGKHGDSVKTANEALALLGVKPAEKK